MGAQQIVLGNTYRIDGDELRDYLRGLKFPDDFLEGPMTENGLDAMRRELWSFAYNTITRGTFDRLAEQIRKWRRLDWLLCLTGKRYRDHASHSWNVAMLGLVLLNTKVRPCSKGKRLWELTKESLNLPFSEEIYKKTARFAWGVAAILHDYAYPLAYVLETASLFSEMLGRYRRYKGITQQSLSDAANILKSVKLFPNNAIGLIEEQNTDIRDENIKQYIRNSVGYFLQGSEIDDIIEKDPYSHGLWSAISLSREIPRWGIGGISDLLNEYWKQVLRAITLHDSNQEVLGKKVGLDTDPLAWVLILCDELQEWGRQTLYEGQVQCECDHVEIHGIRNFGDAKNAILEKKLEFVFCYKNQDALYNTNWDRRKFVESKEEKLGFLSVPKGYRPHDIEFTLKLPGSKRDIKLCDE